MNNEPVDLSYEQAGAMLEEGERIHTFRNPGGMLVGADWDRADILTAIQQYGAELAGPVARAFGHGLVLKDERGWLYIATREQEGG